MSDNIKAAMVAMGVLTFIVFLATFVTVVIFNTDRVSAEMACADTRQELADLKAEVRAGTIDLDALRKRMEEF